MDDMNLNVGFFTKDFNIFIICLIFNMIEKDQIVQAARHRTTGLILECGESPRVQADSRAIQPSLK